MANWKPDVSLAAAEVPSWTAPGGIFTILEKGVTVYKFFIEAKHLIVTKHIICLYLIMSNLNV